MRVRSTQEKVVIALSGISFLGIFPFSILRFMRSEWLIGIIDLSVSILMLITCIYVFTSGKVKVARILFALLCLLGALTSLYLKGSIQIYWMYPAIFACYCIMPAREAFVLSSTASLLSLVLIYHEVSPITLSSITATQVIINIFAFFFSKIMQENQLLLASQAKKDPLTQIGNRRALDERLIEITRAQNRIPSSTCLIIFDLDHFKRVNDENGHRFGDEVLVSVINEVKQRIRTTDSLYRFGGEEFVIVPLAIGIDAALSFAEELRLLIEGTQFLQKINITISLGVAKYQQGETYGEWLDRADQALYRAKRLGRNQSCIAGTVSVVDSRVLAKRVISPVVPSQRSCL